MRSYPDDQTEAREALEELQCEPWMLEELKRNPEYMHWGPHEDYQWIEDKTHPNSPREYSDWTHFTQGFTVGHHPEDPRDRSGGEIVHWYFRIQRHGQSCGECSGSGLNPESFELDRSWYHMYAADGKGWASQLTQDEVDALLDHGRLSDLVSMPTLTALERLVAEGKIDRSSAMQRWESRNRAVDVTCKDGTIRNYQVRWRDQVSAEEVNQLSDTRGLFHDAINQWICVEQRAKRLGVWGKCRICKGDGRVYTEPKGRLMLVLWVANPKTGQSYGVEIHNITKAEIPAVHTYIRECGARLMNRLSFEDADGHEGWFHRDSCLQDNKGWGAPVENESWEQFDWSLDDLNELIGVQVVMDSKEASAGRLYAWIAHPRKGASRLVNVHTFKHEDLASIAEWVAEGRKRTQERFACVPRESST